MEDLTLPNIGASFKKWVCWTPNLPKALAHSLNFQKKEKEKKRHSLQLCTGSGVGRRAIVGLQQPGNRGLGGLGPAGDQQSPTSHDRVPEPQLVQMFLNFSYPFFSFA
jgi:hypothetical protein